MFHGGKVKIQLACVPAGVVAVVLAVVAAIVEVGVLPVGVRVVAHINPGEF